jgi:hypothetical protein
MSRGLTNNSLATYNIEQRNNMYMSSGMVSSTQNFQPRSLPSQHRQYANGHPNKKRRSTATTKLSIQSQPPPLPTPTSATHPPIIRKSRPSDAGTSDTTSNPSPRDTKANLPANHAIPPYTPPPNSGALIPPSTNGSGLSMPYSPNFSFSPLPQFASLAPSPVPRAANLGAQDNSVTQFDPMLSMATPYDQHPTPGAGSTSGASVHTDPDSKDPFLSLLEQLAENEVSRGGPSELDFFLGGQSG